MTERTWFPGKDFPDREKWLAVRSTPQRKPRGRMIYTGVNASGAKSIRKPLFMGINSRKRIEARRTGTAHGRLPKRAESSIIRARHAYYTQSKGAV